MNVEVALAQLKKLHETDNKVVVGDKCFTIYKGIKGGKYVFIQGKFVHWKQAFKSK